jgi:uncharacterized protein (DUF433 family)
MSRGGKRARQSERCLGFRGTRMPVAAIFENLEDGMSIEEIMEHSST